MRVARKRDGISRKVPERLSLDVAIGNMLRLSYRAVCILSKKNRLGAIHGFSFFLALVDSRLPEQPGANMLGDSF